MGTDITFFAEHRLADGNWSIVDPLVANEAYFPDDPDSADEPRMVAKSLDIPRNSHLFAVLAGIKSGVHGDTHVVSISEPRGLPVDATPITRAWHDAWDDVFGVSWLSLEDIDSFDWQQTMQLTAMVDQRAEHLFANNPLGFPFTNWPEGVEQSYAEYKRDGIQVCWRATYAEASGFKWFREMLKPYEHCNDVRFVFWFDA